MDWDIDNCNRGWRAGAERGQEEGRNWGRC